MCIRRLKYNTNNYYEKKELYFQNQEKLFIMNTSRD